MGKSGRKLPDFCGWLPRCQARFSVLAFWSGAVFCPACWCSRHGLLALMESANRVPICFSGY